MRTNNRAAAITGVTASLLAGLIFSVVGFLNALANVRLILLERQGKCDYLPCANQQTYFAAGISVIVTLAGIGLLAGMFILLIRRR